MKSYKEFLNEVKKPKKNIRGEVLGSDFQIYDFGKGKHIILIIGDGGDQYEHPYYLKKNDTIDKLRQRFYRGKSITIPNPFLSESKYEDIAGKMIKKALKDLGENPSGMNINNSIYANAIENISIMLSDGNKRKAEQEAESAAEQIASKVNEERKHKYNSITKVQKALGGTRDHDEIIDFIRKEYDLSNPDHADIVADIVGYYKIAPEEYFDEDGNLLIK